MYYVIGRDGSPIGTVSCAACVKLPKEDQAEDEEEEAEEEKEKEVTEENLTTTTLTVGNKENTLYSL